MFVLVGGGGSGMAAIGFLFHELQYPLIIIDPSHNSNTDLFEQLSIPVYYRHGEYQLTTSDIVIYSKACEFTPEVLDAKKKGLPVHDFSDFLEIVSRYFKTISIGGSHGKSTTTGMTLWTMSQLIPDLALGFAGSPLPFNGGTNYYCNPELRNDIASIFSSLLKGEFHSLMKRYWVVIEADEFSGRLVKLHTDVGVITNVDHDHVDVYPTLESYQQIYQKFVEGVKGPVFVHQNHTTDYLEGDNIHFVKTLDNLSFEHVLGEHNLIDGSLCLHVVNYVDSSVDARGVLKTFPGIGRRMEKIYASSELTVLSDYAIHPTEIAMVLKTVRPLYSYIEVIFEPHQARRVISFWDQFSSALHHADTVTITSIYHAREDLESIAPLYREKFGASLESFDQLSKEFAQFLGATQISLEDISTRQFHKGLVICFTAGSLDRVIRTIDFEKTKPID